MIQMETQTANPFLCKQHLLPIAEIGMCEECLKAFDNMDMPDPFDEVLGG